MRVLRRRRRGFAAPVNRAALVDILCSGELANGAIWPRSEDKSQNRRVLYLESCKALEIFRTPRLVHFRPSTCPEPY